MGQMLQYLKQTSVETTMLIPALMSHSVKVTSIVMRIVTGQMLQYLKQTLVEATMLTPVLLARLVCGVCISSSEGVFLCQFLSS